MVPELRRQVNFMRMNLMDATYPVDRDVDIIFCRNVLIYFDKETQRKVVEQLCTHLRPGGYLMVGHSESMIHGVVPGLKQVQPTIFQDREARSEDMPTQKVRVLIVDNSASVRQILTSILSEDPDIEVMATASDPFAAARRLQNELPDVIILDIEMPRMDGMTFLRKIMAQRPIPVIICSSLTEHGSDLMFEAFEAGAVDILPKPRIDTRQALLEMLGAAARSGEVGARARGCGRAPSAA